MYEELTCHGVTFFIKGLDVDLVKEVSDEFIKTYNFHSGESVKLIGTAEKTTVIIPEDSDEFELASPCIKLEQWDEVSGDFPPRLFENIDEAEDFEKRHLALGQTVHKEVIGFQRIQ